MPGGISSHEESRRNRNLLEVLNVLASSQGLDLTLQKIVSAAAGLTESETAYILLYDQQMQAFSFLTLAGIAADQAPEILVPLEASVAGWVFSRRRPLIIQEADDDPRLFREIDRQIGSSIRSVAAAPLRSGNEPIGVLEAVNKRGSAHYTQDDLHILEALAAQSATVINNARLSAALEQTQEELHRLETLKTEFIAISSHELRTPLGLVLGHATYLKEIAPQDCQEQVEAIIRSASRLKEIIEDITHIAHKDQGKSRVRRVPFSMALLLEDIFARFKPRADEKGISIELDLPDDQPMVVNGEREKLEVAIANVIENALAFTNEGGQVGIQAEQSESDVSIYVADDGIGIPNPDLERIFDRFYQVETHLTRKHGGMGLGLSIARTMVEMHGGRIWCESKENVGSLFCITVPIGAAPKPFVAH